MQWLQSTILGICIAKGECTCISKWNKSINTQRDVIEYNTSSTYIITLYVNIYTIHERILYNVYGRTYKIPPGTSISRSKGLDLTGDVPFDAYKEGSLGDWLIKKQGFVGSNGHPQIDGMEKR